jgi:hypothetical protein
VSITIHTVKTVLLALTAAISFGAAIIVGMGGVGGLNTKTPNYRAISCEPTASSQVAVAPSSWPSATC